MRNLNALFARYIHRLRTSRLVTRRPGSALRRASRPLRAPGGGWETLEARVLLRTITENVTTNGADYSLTDSDEIVIAAGVVIDTSSLTGPAGNISLSAPSITLDTGARLLATAAGGDGTIELSARDTLKNPKISLFNQLENLALVAGQRNLQSAISLASGVEIAGGDVTLATESGNPSENKVYNQVVSLVVQPLGPFLMEALEKPDLFAGPLAFQLWKPSATISIDSATLTSSHSLSITSTADANASGKAVYNRVVGVEHAKSSGRFGGAAGYFETDAVATISVTGASVIHAEEELTVSTTVDNAIALEVLAIKNNGISPTNPQAIDLAGGYTLLHTTSTVQIGEGSQLVAGGTVEIAAEATDENEVGVTANAYRDGTLGASYAMMKSGATVQVLVAGQVSSGVVAGTVDDLPELEFNPALAVDFATDSLLFPTPVPFATGAPLYFTSACGATVPGLVPGSVYFAIASGSNPNQLQLATTREQALAGEAISFGTPFPTLTVAGVTLPISVLDSAVSNSVLFGFANGTGGVPTLQSGQVVTYTPAPGRLIGYNDAQGNLLGLLPAGQYTLELVDSINPELFPLACQLQTTSATQLPGFAAGAVVLLNDASVLTSADGTWLPIYGFDLDASQLDLNPPAVDPTTGEPVTTPPATIPLQNGAAVVFHSGLNNPAGNLVDGTTYYALVDASNPGVIRLATSLAQAVAQDPAVQNAVPTLVTVDAQSFLESVAASFDQSKPLEFQQNSNLSYSLWSGATSGTFTLTVTTPQQTSTTAPLAYNISAADLQAALDGLTGLQTSVSGQGTSSDPWVIFGQYVLAFGTIEEGTNLAFDFDPGFAAGTAVQYQAVAGKPISGLTDGATYYATAATNAFFNPNLPQYLLTLASSAASGSPAIAMPLSQSLTDPQGRVYTVSGVAADSGLLLVELPDSATVTAVEAGGLIGGTAELGSVPAGAVQCFSFATGGSFALTVTPASGANVGTPTTVTLDWNSSAGEIAAALNAIPGVQVTVYGTGVYTSPWTIAGLTLDEVSTDSSELVRNGKSTALMTRELTAPASLVSTTATGGTLALSLTAGGVTQTTAALAWNATADDVAAQINQGVTGVRASVTGTGLPDDPWLIIAGDQSLTTGMAVTYQDSWNLPNLGLTNGQVCYVVVQSEQVVPQTLIVGLAATYAEAMQATPVLINQQPWYALVAAGQGIMTGAPATLAELAAEGEASGISVVATLESSDSAKSSANLGLFPLMGYVVHPRGNWLGAQGANQGIEQELAHKIPAGMNLPNSFELTAAPAVAEVKNVVQALVLGTASLETAGVVTIASELTEIVHSTSTASIAKPTLGANDKAVAIAFNLALVNNTAQAVIAPGGWVTGGSGVSVTSDIEYPFVLRETNLSGYRRGTLTPSTVNRTQTAENILSNAIFSSMGGISKWLFNHLSNSAFASEESRDAKDPGVVKERALGWSIGFSLSGIEIQNSNLAQIADGAQINQATSLAGTDQPVTVEAQTEVVQTTTAGQVFPGLSLLWLQYALKKSSPTDVFDLTSAETAIGGSLVVFDQQGSTQALVGGDCLALAPPGVTFTAPDVPTTTLAFGNGGLTVEALNLVTNVLVVQAGAKSSGFGFEGSFGLLDMGNASDSDSRRQITRAQLLSTNRPLQLQAQAGTTGAVEIKAEDTSDLWVVSGAVLWGAPRAIGLSGSVIEVDREVAAGVGTGALSEAATMTSLWDLGGDFEISATAGGVFAPASLVGEYAGRGGPETAPKKEAFKLGEKTENSVSNPEGHWGLNVSGDFAGAFTNDAVTAWLADQGTLTGVSGDTLGVSAANTTRTHAVAGAAAIVNAGRGQGATAGSSGSVGMIEHDSLVEAQVASVTLAGLAVEVQAVNNKLLGSFAGGLQVAVVTDADLQLAGSVAFNQVTNTTGAELTGVTGTGLEEVQVEAVSSDEAWAAAGVLSVNIDRADLAGDLKDKAKTIVGVGASGAMQGLTNATTAQVSDSELEVGGAVAVEAADYTRSLVLSAGVDVTVSAGTDVTVGGMFATTNLRPNTQALVTGSQITSETQSGSQPLDVSALLIPALVGTAGYVSLDWGKLFSFKENEVGVGVGAGVVVTNIAGDGTDLAQTVARVTASDLDWNTGEVAVTAYSGAMTAGYETSATPTTTGTDSLYLLAVAGSAQAENGSAVSVGVDVAGAVIVSTLALDTWAVVEQGDAAGATAALAAGAVEVLATEAFSTQSDAGGAVLAEQGATYSPTAVGVAVGGGWNEWSATNSVEALVTSVDMTAESLEVAALLDSTQTQVAFGVAVDAALSSGVGVSVSLSGAWGYHTLDNTVQATVSGGTLELDGGLQVTATDDSTLSVKAGAGSLAVASGAGTAVAIAPSAAMGAVTVTNTIAAAVGLAGAGGEVTELTTGGAVEIAARDAAEISAILVAVAASVAVSEDGVALSGSGTSATITTANTVQSLLGDGVTLAALAGDTTSLAVSANESAALSAAVAASALSVGFAGGSLGVSLAAVTTADTVAAGVAGASVATAGGDVEVSATTDRSVTTLSVPTSVAIALGAAGAGGNSNITDSSNFSASVTGGAAIDTRNLNSPATPAGDLTVQALGQETLEATIDGGAGGLGSVGVFLSTVERTGSLTTTLDGLVELQVGNLAVTAVSAHTITSSGTSVTIGGLAGTGETHTTSDTETIAVNLANGPSSGAALSGGATILSQSTTQVAAQSVGAIGGLLGVGVYTADATSSPTVATTLDQFPMTAGGALQVGAQVAGLNTARAIAGSGGLFSGEASKAVLQTSPTVSTTITASALTGASLSVQALDQSRYNAYSDSVNAAVLGMSGAIVVNTAAPAASLQLAGGTALQATTGGVTLGAQTALINLGGEASLVDAGGQGDLAMVRLGAGGGLVGYAGGVYSNYTPSATLVVGDGVTVTAPQGIGVVASQDFQSSEVAVLKTGGLIDVSVAIAQLTANFDTTLTIGESTTWQSSLGDVELGTVVSVSADNLGLSKTWGLAGGADGQGASTIAVAQGVTVGAGTTITALDDVVILAGENPTTRQVTQIDALSMGDAHFGGLAGDAFASSTLNMSSASSLGLATGSVVKSGGDVIVGAHPGVNSTTQYASHGYDRNFRTTNVSAGTVTESAEATLDGSIAAGAFADLDVVIDATGTQLTVNGQVTSLATGNAGFVNTLIAPPNTSQADLFLPFQAAFNPQYLPSLAGFDEATAALLESSVSQSSVPALQLSGLAAQGGQVVVMADQLAGSGTLSAAAPRITISNPSADYLLLNGVTIPGGQTAGQVTLKGATGGAPANPGLVLQPSVGAPAVIVSQTYPAAVGTGTSSGPAIYVTGSLNNPAGEVTLSNTMGAVIELAPINAATVSIETPNSAFILDTPQSPFGVGGDIADAWGATRQPLNPQPGVSTTGTPPVPALTGAFLPGQTQTGWDANLAATTVVDYLFNGTPSSLAYGARTLTSPLLGAEDFAEYALYNDSDVKDSNPPNHNPNGNSWIFFGNAIPFYNTGWGSSSPIGGSSDTREDAGTASFLGSGSGYYANSTSSSYQFAYNGPGDDAGALPLVVPNLPLQVTQPDSAVQGQLSTGLTAAQVSITAALIDINAPLNVGVSRNVNVVLPATLGSSLAAYRAQWQQGTVASPLYTIPESSLGLGVEGVTATYNAQTHQITLSSLATSSSTVSALLTGGIVSTVSTGKINVIGGPGITSVTNATGIPLVLSGIDAGATQVTGVVEINDTLRQVSTRYVYTPGDGLEVFTAPLNQAYASTPTSSGPDAVQTYQPLPGVQINQQQSAGLVRELNFTTPGGTNGNGCTNVATGNVALRPAPVGTWNFANTTGTTTAFAEFNPVGAATLASNDTVLTLTDGVLNTASAAWLPSSLNTTVGFEVAFTYQAAGAKAADGIAFVFQNQGPAAVGGVGGALGYVGLSGSTAAYQMNIYNGHTIGTAFVTTNTSGTYTATGSVNIASGDPINVVLAYDPLTQTLVETLTDTITGASFTTTHTGINLAGTLGESCFVGFTGGDGGATSIQTISNFTLATDQVTPWSPATTTLTLNGFSNFTGVNTTLATGGGTATLTNGSANTASAAWKNTPLDLVNGFAIGFVYQAAGNRAGDGIACVFQTAGLNAVGQAGGGLGYVGIPGNTAAYEMNIFSTVGVGTSFVTTNTSGTYSSTGAVNIASGDPIQVQLVYNPLQQVLVETLTDQATGATYTTTHLGINLAAALGAAQCYVGFTGGSGADTAIQTVSNLVIALPSASVAPVNSLLAQAAVSVALPEGAALAQFVTVEGSGSVVSVTNRFGNNGSGPPWGVGNGNTWNYHYPTYYQLFQSSAVKADNPFQISFEAMQPGGLSVVSTADLVIDGLIRMAGDVGLSSVGSISQTLLGSIAAQNVDLVASSNRVLAGFDAANPLNTIPTPGSVTLSDGQTNAASAVWLNTSLDTTVGFTAQFTYQASGNRAADGIALVFQNEGLSALGNTGGALGYVGISGATAAYQVNLYSPHTVGTNFVTTNTSGTYQATGAVNVASGNPIDVVLVYDPAAQTLVETLTDTITLATFTKTHAGLNLAGVLGDSCFLGFTGADGGATSIQTVSGFQLSTQVTASIGSASAPVQVTLTPGAALDAFAPGGVFISSDGDLTVDAVAAIPLEISGFMAGTAEWALVNGDSGIEDFTSFVLQGDATLTTVNGVPGLLTLTDGTGYSASAAWAPVAVATAGFTVNFQYQATGLAQADGIAVVFQNAGTSALGGDGGSLGYVGIPGQTVAYEMNLYSKWGVGTNFVTTNSSTQYNSTGAVNIASGNPIAVQLVYDAITQTLTETLTETISAGQTATYQKVYTSIRLPALLGPTATFGFTGGDGALTSIQQVSLLPNQPLFQQTVPQLIGNGLLAIPSTGVGDQISAAWHRTPVSINRDFSTSFVYQAKGVNPADGLALVFQNAGLDALGDLATYGGSSLGYAGLGNNLNTAAYEINIYSDQAPHVVGSNVAVNGAYGSYNTTGDVSFASGHKISVTLDYSASAGELTESLIDLTTGATWQRVYPLDLATTLAAETALIGFTAANGAAFAEQVVTEFQFAYDIESTADVVLTATAGSIVMAGEGSLVRGANVTLEAASSVGAAVPVRVRLDTQTLANGTVLGGVLSGTAGAGFAALVPVGDLRLRTVVAGGTVSLAVPSGNLVDGLTADASSLNRVANPAHRGRIQQLLWQSVTAPTQQTIASYEALIDRDYVQYWSLVSNGSVVAGVFTLNTAALPQFEPQAALYYGVPTASDAQVQSWAALTYVDCVNTFASSLALGPDWASLPEFAEYDPTWEFVAPPATVIALSQGSESVFGVVSAASLVALNSAAVSGGGPGVNLEAGQVVLSAGGTIGLIQEPVVIPLSDISNQTLTAEQRSLLELASVAGALQMVGVSTTGETICYGFSQPPAGVTPTGVQVEFSRPVFTKIATGGTLSASAESVSLTQVVGSLTVDSVVAPGAVRLESQGSLLSSASSGTAVQSGDLTLISGGSLGGVTNPLGIAATGVVRINATGDVALTQPAGELQIGQIQSGGQVWLQATDSIVDGRASERESFTGFNTNGTGWNVTLGAAVELLPASPSVSVSNNIATFTNPVNVVNSTPVANSAVFWRTEAVHLDADWTAGFVYQGGSAQGGLSLMLYNGSEDAADPSPAWTSSTIPTGVVLNLPGTTWNTLPLQGNQVGLLSPNSGAFATPGAINLGAGHPIRVVVAYTALESTLIVELTDLVTGDQFTLENPNENLVQALGTNAVRFGFEAYATGASAVVQTVSDFVVLDGAANIAAASLEAVTGGGRLGFLGSTGVNVTPTANSVTLTDGINSNANAVWLNTPLDTTVGFTAQFTYQAEGNRAADGVAFVFQNQGLTALGGVGGSLGYVGITGATAAYQMNLYSPNTVGTTFVTTNTSGQYGATGSVNIASGDPIEVTLVYDPVAGTVVETLIDSVASTTFSRTYSGVNLAQLLGNSCVIGFTGADGGSTSIQTITNFTLIPTGATAAIGSATVPLTLLISDSVSMVGPGGINLLEMAGNLSLGVLTASSSSTIEVAAPLGSVEGTASAQSQGAMLGGASTQSTTWAEGPQIVAGAARLAALIDVGAPEGALQTRVGQLNAVARRGDLFVSNRGALTIFPDSAGLGLSAGHALEVRSSQSLQVAADVFASGDLKLEVGDWGLAQQALTVAGGTEIAAQTGVVTLRAPDVVSLSPNSVVSTLATNPGPNVIVALTRTTAGGTNPQIQSAGRIVADRVSMLGKDRGVRFELAHAGFVGQTQPPVVTVAGTTGVDQLVLNHRAALTGQSFVISATGIENASASYAHSSLDSLVLLLGDLGDEVTIRDAAKLRLIDVQGYGGNDRFRVEFERNATNLVQLDGGLGSNSLVYDGAGMPLWAKLGVVQSLTAQVVHKNLQNLVPWNIAALNGNPYLSTVDVAPLLVGLTATQRYVQRTYLQIVQRVATTAELNQWTTYLDQAPTDLKRRTQLVDTLSATDAARTLLLQAWFATYVGRAGTPAEITTWLATFRSVSNPLTVQQRFLNSTPVYNAMQTYIATGTPDQRYISGLWRLLVDPGTPTSANTLDYWMKQQTQLGRAKMTANMLGHLSYVSNQAQAFTQLINQRNAQYDELLARGPALVTFTGSVLDLSAAKVISPFELWRWLLTNRVS